MPARLTLRHFPAFGLGGQQLGKVLRMRLMVVIFVILILGNNLGLQRQCYWATPALFLSSLSLV